VTKDMGRLRYFLELKFLTINMEYFFPTEVYFGFTRRD